MMQSGHICNKCGWGFPNPHPSAKQRRAHKKVCGKIQGFIIHESQDDDNYQEHSNNQGENNLNEEMGSGLIDRQISNKSEEEEFSDAVNEFAETDLKGTTTTTTAAAAKDIQPSDSPTQYSSSRTPNAPQNTACQTENDAEFQSPSSTLTMGSPLGFVSDQEAESLSFDLPNQANGSPCSIPVKAEGPEIAPNDKGLRESAPYIVKDVGTKDEMNSNGMLSANKASFSDSATEDSEIVIMQKADGILRNSLSSIITGGSNMSAATLPMDGVVDSKEMETNTLEQKMSLTELHSGICSDSIELGASKNAYSSEDSFKDEDDCACLSDTENPNGSYEKEGSNNLLTFQSEELPEATVKDQKENVPVKLEVCPKVDFSEVTTEIEFQNPISMDVHPRLSGKSGESTDVSPLATLDLEDIGQQRGICNESKVEEDSTTHNGDISKVKDVHQSLDKLGFPDLEAGKSGESTNVSPLSILDLEDIGQQKEMCNESKFDEDSTTHDTDISEAKDVHHGLDKSTFPDLKFCDVDCIHTETNQMVCFEELEPHYSQQDKPSKSPPPSLIVSGDAIISHIVGVAEDHSMQMKIDSDAQCSLVELEENLQNSESGPLNSVVQPSAVVINTTQFENMSESLSESQNYHDGSYAEPLPEDRNVNSSNEDEAFHVPSAPNSSSLEDAAEVLGLEDASDVSSSSLKEDDFLLDKQLEALATVPREGSVDSISQTGSVEGCWGSVSDGKIPCSRDAMNPSHIPAAEVLPGTDSKVPKKEDQVAESEKTHSYKDQYSSNSDVCEAPSILIVAEPSGENGQNLQQPHESSLQAPANELQGRKKNEEIIEKVTNWSSAKVRAPLKSFLVEPNFESSQDATAHGNSKPPASEDDDTFKTVPPIASLEVSTTNNGLTKNIDKEWSSPARLPDSRQKRKTKWVPFLCCLSVN
ncbi:hypothetical protein AQUCO_05800147v1 [Aquilegia coerulea]|uniref:Uncharacterized protein n=1 Tax=Aquilegia coerulea TaxID=218851 RepID=A0A2G5CGD0_AQUCA|nr:hypothetical protein AQUCO_05800147v1 [Aquilegia coerulea]